MRRVGPRVNLAMYGQAFVHLVRHPSILALPLLAAILDMFTSYWQSLFTDPLGGYGGGLFQFVIQILYLFAFGGAVALAVCPLSSVTVQVTVVVPVGAPAEENVAELPVPLTEPAEAE